MATIAVYSLKGGVGKSTLAVGLGWCAAARAARRTLVWDLDAQAAATWLLAGDAARREEARALFERGVEPLDLVDATRIANLSLLPADRSLRSLDRLFHTLDKRRRRAKLAERLTRAFDRVILDCPPGQSDTAEQILRAATIVVVPVIPSPLARRAFDEVVAHLRRERGSTSAILPVFSMVDRRRALHLQALRELPDWPVVPMASVLETLTASAPLDGGFPIASPAGKAIDLVWRGIERRLAD